MNQYQANHNRSTKPADSSSFYSLLRVVIVVALLVLGLWIFS
jgi:hypothetical protein